MRNIIVGIRLLFPMILHSFFLQVMPLLSTLRFKLTQWAHRDLSEYIQISWLGNHLYLRFKLLRIFLNEMEVILPYFIVPKIDNKQLKIRKKRRTDRCIRHLVERGKNLQH